MSRIIILDDDHDESIPDMNKVFSGTLFIHAKEIDIKIHLCSAIRELSYSLKNFRNILNDLLDKGTTEELSHYLEEIKTLEMTEGQVEIILESTKLSYYFKTYLFFVKSVLDKTIPFINYRYKFKEKIFEARGKNLIRFLKSNYKGNNKNELINLIENAKHEWLDEVLLLRDEFVHNSSLTQYKDFSIFLTRENQKQIKGLNDFISPTIIFKGNQTNAISFLEKIHDNLLQFLNHLLMFFGFDKYKAPEFRTECPKCNFKYFEITDSSSLFIPKPTTINVYNSDYEHGIIICPNCEREVEIPLTPLKRFGFNIQNGN